MDDRFNTIAGWTLFAGIVALGASIVAGESFHSERPEHMGFPIEGVVEEGAGAAEAEKPIAFYLASADPAAGEQVFKKCTACHNADQGGANALGPNLWDVLGEPVGKGKGFPFSPALSGVGGTWNWDNMNAWLTSPKKFAPGTKMTFAGLSNPQDRANVIAFLNAHSDAPLPLPAAPAEAAAPAAGDKAAADNAAGTGTNDGPQVAKDVPADAKKPGGGEAVNQAAPAH
ncbi:cytochrome c family protein [Sphingomonas daechungensis]|uniref:c-type cytochrome n=1 Tax=Sphingomonas daechungensis TaxID=1176646 RepID=UPI0031EC778C